VTWNIELLDEGGTRRLAEELAHDLRPDDLVTLSGDLGVGKTTFARALIRNLAKDQSVEVPSPTFTLMQVYQGKTCPIVHADLYRLKEPDDLAQLGWDEAASGAIVMAEWADRAGDQLPEDRLDVAFALAIARGPDARDVVITGHGAFAPRLDRMRAIHGVLKASGWDDAERAFMLGDASTRAYERLTKPDGSHAILMISPPRTDGPPIRDGKPYSAIARLAENITPFIAVDHALRAQSLSAPEIFASDRNGGVAVLEDLGAEGVVDANGPIAERYSESVAVLASLHARELPSSLPLNGVEAYQIPVYDLEALMVEVDLFLEWYAPAYVKKTVHGEARESFETLWKEALTPIVEGPRTWSLRDYHSPNLIWLPKRDGLARVGIIDFQDCVMGHPAYDVASLAQDARVTVSDDLELKLLSRYARERRALDPAFDVAAFARAYAALGAQRATKILGIFARLDKRDAKPQYLAHLPRVRAYLARDLAHPALADLRAWFEAHSPDVFTPAS
jgi:tRNA threonylcarbamoyl adenosine modification protein YjeE